MRVASQAVYFPASLLLQDNHTYLRTESGFARGLTDGRPTAAQIARTEP